MDLFISYTHMDRPVAAAIAGELAKLAIEVWWDHDLIAGEDYRRHITEMLARTPAVIVLWSRRSIGSQWVLAEATTSSERRTLIPISIDGERPPIDFRSLHTIQLDDWCPGDPLPQEVVRAVAGLLGRSISYSAQLPQIRGVARLAKQATAAWYLDFESLLFYLFGLGMACFLCELPIPTLARRCSIADHVQWAPWVLSPSIGIMVAALYMRPVLEQRRLQFAIPILTLAALLSLVAYGIANAVTGALKPDELLIIFGLDSFIFVLVTALAERAIHR